MEKKQSYSIYIVDDDKIYLNTLEHTLKKSSGKEVMLKTFATGEECMQQLKICPPDLLVLDYYLNKDKADAANGLKILQKAKLLNQHINIVMLSGQEKLGVAIDSIRLGAYDYIVKDENAFKHVKSVVKNILRNVYLKREMTKYEFGNKIIATIILAMIFSYLVYFIVKLQHLH